MSLFDVDKSDENRINPQANHTDTVGDIDMSKGTNSVNYTSGASDLSKITAGKSGLSSIVKVGSFSISSVPNTGNAGLGHFLTETVNLFTDPHNLGFIPSIVGYMFTQSSYFLLPFINHLNDTPTRNAFWITYMLRADETNVYFDRLSTTYNGFWTFNGGVSVKYYLLEQKAS